MKKHSGKFDIHTAFRFANGKIRLGGWQIDLKGLGAALFAYFAKGAVFEFSSHCELLFSLLETGISAPWDPGAYTHIDDSRLRKRNGLLLAIKRISGRKRRRGACRFRFCVYVAGQTRRADLAVARLRRLCEELIPGDYEIEVIDVANRPDLAKAHQVVITPAILRNLPAPLRKSIGDFSNKEKALLGLGLFDFDHLRLG